MRQTVDFETMRMHIRAFVKWGCMVLGTYMALTYIFEGGSNSNSDPYEANTGRANRGIAHYLSDKNDDVDLMVDFFVGKKKPSFTEMESSLPAEDETRDLPDLEVPNWNVVHDPETAKMTMNDEIFRDQMNDSRVDTDWLEKRKAILERGEPKKVFIFAYMRGGSTLLGQVFNHDPEVIVWYEPLAPFYGSMYGLPKYRHYRRVVFPGDGNYKTDFREIGKWEMDNLVHFFRNLFGCNLEGLPREALSDVFLTFTGNMQDYSMCYYNESRTMSNGSVVWETQCKEESGLAAYCSGEKYDQAVEYSIKQKCQRYISGTAKIFRRFGNVNQDELKDLLYKDSGLRADSDATIEAFYKHEKCLSRLYENVKRCLQRTKVEASCSKTSIRAAKILRLKMPYVEPIIRAFPDMFIVHYFRDPRAMAKSRVEIASPQLPVQLWVNATKRMCIEMQQDIKAAINIKQKYPGVFLNLRYEDVVVNTKDTLQTMYSHFGKTLSQETYEWVTDIMHANEDDGAFGVKRKNASALINNWRHFFPKEAIDEVNSFDICNLVLTYLGYEL